MDDEDNIPVVDYSNNRIQKFTSDGKFITAVDKLFKHPTGITTHPLNRKIYVADAGNHRIQILNPDLTLSSSFGCRGDDNGQFYEPYDVACDSSGDVCVTDHNNNRVQVFTAERQFLRKFGKKGKGDRDLAWPCGITVDDDVVYVTEYKCSLFCVHMRWQVPDICWEVRT